ncbi:hypothetical protein THRCLA_11472 [Thraustotheca clavata]|uniref:RING-type domain-containing protein n=1 Tax=Thraustotheca clavata TaxID=74557 RepID=A0A1V9Y7L5_9STRA|nr:hypothetical protein THRCLA_11472 [Thraustotheca clavata]
MNPTSHYSWIPALKKQLKHHTAIAMDIENAIYTSAQVKKDSKGRRHTIYSFVIISQKAQSWSIVQKRYSDCRTLYKSLKSWTRSHRGLNRPLVRFVALVDKMEFPSRTLGFDDYYTSQFRKLRLTAFMEFVLMVHDNAQLDDTPAIAELYQLLSMFIFGKHSANDIDSCCNSLTRSALSWTMQDDSCSICLNDLSADMTNPVFGLSCGHIFHQECALRWFEYQSVCPICRNPCKQGRTTCAADLANYPLY